MIKPSGYKRNHFVVTEISAKNRCPENTPSYFLAQQLGTKLSQKYKFVQHLTGNVRAEDWFVESHSILPAWHDYEIHQYYDDIKNLSIK